LEASFVNGVARFTDVGSAGVGNNLVMHHKIIRYKQAQFMVMLKHSSREPVEIQLLLASILCVITEVSKQ
jgi:hypothetical protein